MADDNTRRMLVCTSLLCRCGAQDEFECDCKRGSDGRCTRCRARMVTVARFEREREERSDGGP